jgi:hypothetical protein
MLDVEPGWLEIVVCLDAESEFCPNVTFKAKVTSYHWGKEIVVLILFWKTSTANVQRLLLLHSYDIELNCYTIYKLVDSDILCLFSRGKDVFVGHPLLITYPCTLNSSREPVLIVCFALITWFHKSSLYLRLMGPSSLISFLGICLDDTRHPVVIDW